MPRATDRHDEQMLLERDHELALIERLIDGAVGGSAGLVLVEGPAGIGKTRLVGEGRRLATGSGFAVVSARGSEFEREFAFGVVRQLFESSLVDVARRERLLVGAAAGASPVFETVAGAVAGTDDESSFAVLHGLYWLTLQLAAERPLLFAIDDLQWCDVPSLRFVTYLLHRIEGQQILVLASLRDTEPGTDPALVGELAADPLTTVIKLAELTEAATGRLVAEWLGGGDRELVSACHESTGGNPLLLTELLRTMIAEQVSPAAASADVVRELGPRAASRSVLLRLSRLGAPATRLARAVAVLGDGCELQTAAELAGVAQATAPRLAAELSRAEVLAPDLPLAFVHPVIGDAVYNDIPAAERELEHLRAAQQQRAAGAEAEQIAAHLLAVSARGDAEAALTLRDAARVAMRRAAPESAVAYLHRALEEMGESPELLLELGTAEALTNGPAAAEHLAAAHRSVADPEMRAGIARGLIHVLGFTGRGPEAVALARETMVELPPAARDLKHAIEALQLHFSCIDRRLEGSVAARLAELASGMFSTSPGHRMLAGITAFHVGQSGGSRQRAIELARHALADGFLVDIDNGGGPQVGAAMVLAMADEPDALEPFDAALDRARRRGSVFEVAAAHLFRGQALLLRGELPAATESLTAGSEALDLWGIKAGRAYPSAFLATALIEQGAIERARTVLAGAGLVDDPDALRDDPTWALFWWCEARARLALADDDPEGALRWVDCAAESFEAIGGENPAWLPWRSRRARILQRLGDREAAAPLAAEELRAARAWGAPWTLGRALRVVGELEPDDRVELLREAVDVLEGSTAQLEHARALAGLGRALRLAKRPTEARDPLRRALELASVCGAEPLVEHVRSELYASGARPRTDVLSGVDALTPSERRIAALAATGRTNRGIAQELFVTPKTVEVHLSNVYRKLSIRSRRELPTALAA